MKLDSSFKNYIPMGIIYFISFFILGYIQDTGIDVQFAVALLGAVAGTITVYALSRARCRRAENVFLELSQSRKIVCHGLATQRGQGAWMFLSDYILDIYYDKIDINGKHHVINLKDITYVEHTNSNVLIVSTPDTTEQFRVTKANIWDEMIREQIDKNKKEKAY